MTTANTRTIQLAAAPTRRRVQNWLLQRLRYVGIVAPNCGTSWTHEPDPGERNLLTAGQYHLYGCVP